MNRVKVKSSMFMAISYNADSKLMELELHNGAILHIFDVPPRLHHHMLNASSIGRFYHRWILDIFDTHVYRDIGGRYSRPFAKVA